MWILKGNVTYSWLIMLISFICLTNARQIRYSRFDTEVMEDNEKSTDVAANQTADNENEIQATVREIKLAPYPASGFRPSSAFPLPNDAAAKNEQNNNDNEAQVTDETPIATTTETIEDFTTTTEGYGREEVEAVLPENDITKAPYPPAGFQPKIPFILPTANLFENERQPKEIEHLSEKDDEYTTELPKTKVKAPYPAAGYRPAKAFLLPSEQLKTEAENKENINAKDDSSKHPACGSSTNPLAPTPQDGEREDPDSESIDVNTQNHQQQQQQQQQRVVIVPEDENEMKDFPKDDNSKHPVCGSSTNPLAPRPLDGEKEDPDSESIDVNTQPQAAVLIPARFTVQPLVLNRPIVYGAFIPSW